MEQTKTKISWGRRITKYALFSLLAIAILLLLSQMAWKLSGSNEWELEIDHKGVQVFTLKAPGSSVLKVKGTVKIKAKLASIVALLQDQSTCEETGCLKAEVIEEVSEQLSYVAFAYPFPYDLENREFVVKSLFYQNPENKEVFFDFTAVPGKIALDDCCFRVSHFYVFWRFTPIANGEVEIELMRDIDPGGFMPDYMVNGFMSGGAYALLARLEGMANREKYKNAEFDFLTELDDNQVALNN